MLTLLQASLEKLRAQTEALEKEQEECEEGMTRLKGVLYAKFGSESCLFFFARRRKADIDLGRAASINLEKGDD